LAEAHSHGLVHRDVKPANIMLNQRGGESDVVKVLDFGLVKAKEDKASNTGIAGTPLYMSPESIQMPESVDACSDVYAVGAVGYFMLTGKPVFDADSFAELCQKQISETPQDPTTIVKEIPEDLAGVIMSCLEKDRSRRPQSARDLARLLKSCAAADNWDSDRAQHWWNRHLRKATEVVVTTDDQFAATMDSSVSP
jgi:serine/threonine protein kinase